MLTFRKLLTTSIETIKVIKSLQNGKAPGHDILDTELFRADPQLSATILQPLFAATWKGEKVPADWTNGVTQDTKEGSTQRLQQLAPHYTAVYTKQDPC